jgi:rod shape-determining protein MreC
VLALLVVVSLTLLTISFRSPSSGALHDLQGYGATALRPFQVAAERVARPFRDVYNWFDGLTSAKSQNAKLRKEVREWRAQALANDAARRRNAELTALLHYEEGATYPKDFRAVNAQVISFPSGAFAQELTIAAGSSSGIRLNTPVVSADGLVGHVTNVGHSTAQVTLLTDPDSAVPARDLATGVSGLIRHSQGTMLFLDRVSKEAVVHKGDVIVTQGTIDRRYPSIYPYGIPIGQVTQVGTSDIASFLTVQVSPFARLGSLDAVAALVSTKPAPKP